MSQKLLPSSGEATCIRRHQRRVRRQWFTLCSHYRGQLRSIHILCCPLVVYRCKNVADTVFCRRYMRMAIVCSANYGFYGLKLRSLRERFIIFNRLVFKALLSLQVLGVTWPQSCNTIASWTMKEVRLRLKARPVGVYMSLRNNC